MKFSKWKDQYKDSRPGERLGQAFVNDFIKGTWTELFYVIDNKKAQEMIIQYLTDNQYWPDVPNKLDADYQRIRSSFLYGVVK